MAKYVDLSRGVSADVELPQAQKVVGANTGTKERLPVALRSSGTPFEEVRNEIGPAIPNEKTGAAPFSCEKSSATQTGIKAVLTLGSTSVWHQAIQYAV